MNYFDTSVIKFLNEFSQKSFFFDSLMAFFADNIFIKGGILVSILWFFWFSKSNRITFIRERIIIGMFSCIVSLFVARGMSNLLSFRLRPRYNPQLHFLIPYNSVHNELISWSSFPSDHAVLYFVLATGIFLISKKIGIFSYLYVFFIICFPRIYLGYTTRLIF